MLFLKTQLDTITPLQLYTLVFQKMFSTTYPSKAELSNVILPLIIFPIYPRGSDSNTDYCI